MGDTGRPCWRRRHASAALRLVAVCAPALAALSLVSTARAAGSPYDTPFAQPQYLIHATGHGTTQGGVKDDLYMLYPQEPSGANGSFTLPDGSGGTIGYSSDFHTGPLGTPRAVCQAAQSRGLSPDTDWAAWDSNDDFTCTALIGAPPSATAGGGGAATGVGLASGGGGIGAPVIALAALAGAGTLAGGVVVVQRARTPQPSAAGGCDEALSRWALMVPRRVDMVQRVTQGTRSLSQAYAAQTQTTAARAQLQSEYTTAVALLAGAGAVAAGALLACAGTVFAAASAVWMPAAMEIMGAAGEGAAGEAAAATARTAMQAAGQTFARAASLARTGTGIGVGAAANAGVIQQLMSSGLASFDEAAARQAALTQQLANACTTLQHDIAELDRSIGDTLATLRGCPNIPQDEIEDPRGAVPSMPQLPGTSIQG